MKKYVVRVLRKDGSLYDERFYHYQNDEMAIEGFARKNKYRNIEYSYELRRYYKNGNTGKKVICSQYNINYQG